MGSPGIRMTTVFVMVMVTAPAAMAEERKASPLVISPQIIQQGIASVQQGIPIAPRQFATPQQRASSAHTGRRVLWTIVGAAGGFFGGGYLGAAIDEAVSPCECDDPGLKGALIGIPIGAVAGGVTGYLLSK